MNFANKQSILAATQDVLSSRLNCLCLMSGWWSCTRRPFHNLWLAAGKRLVTNAWLLVRQNASLSGERRRRQPTSATSWQLL